MNTEPGNAILESDDARHRVLITLLRTQFVASTLGVAGAFAIYPVANVLPIYAGCTAVLVVLAGLAFAPLSYLARARAYSLVFCALSIGLAYWAGPTGSTFVVMCGALILPLILLPVQEAATLVIGCFLVVAAVAWAHIQNLTGVEFPEMQFSPNDPNPWVVTMITILTISIPFAVLAGRLLRMYQSAHETSEQLVEDLKTEVAERQAAIEALQRAERRLTYSQKLELLGQLAGGLAHDMNNALTVIQGEASFLGESDAQSRDIIIEHTNHAAALTRQLLTLGRKDVVQPRAIDFVEEVRKALASLRKLLPSEIEVSESYTSEKAVVHADPSQLAQIVLNLIVNSRDAMVGGGQLRISVETEGDSSSYVALVIADTGHGIEPDALDLIFEPFYSTKPEGMGTGLGLASVKKLVEGLGGTLQIESEVGRGTTLRIRLPLMEEEAGSEQNTSSGATGKGRLGRILLVEDRSSVRRIAKSILARVGHEVIEAPTGRTAIEMLTDGTEFDVVITDVVMPDGGGALVIDWLAKNAPGLPLLVMSGYTEDEQLLRGLRTGELPFLRKPFSAEELLDATQAILDAD